MHGRALDLFAGSGQLGIEALSNGCDSVVFCDHDAISMKLVKENVKRAGYGSRSEILDCDYKHFLKYKAGREEFDVIFLDPPFDSLLAGKSLTYIAGADCLKPGGLIVLEAPLDSGFQTVYGNISLKKTYRYGQIAVHIYTKAGE